MNPMTRRKLIATGLVAATGAVGLAAASRIAARYGLLPPDSSGLYGSGETLTYASQRLITRHSLAREFSRSQISPRPVENVIGKPTDEFRKLQANGFADWRLSIDGMVAHPMSFSIADIRRFPAKSQITMISCEEGWSYIAEWIGTPLSNLLAEAGVHPDARSVVYRSMEEGWMNNVDMADALHPQTFVAYGMNDADIPVPSGGPLRLRVPRQLGYKSVKFVNHITVTDSLKNFALAPGEQTPDFSYSWYAGI